MEVLCLIVSLVNTAILVAIARTLVKTEETNKKRLKKFLADRGLLDIPVVFEGQNDYTDHDLQRQSKARRASQMKYIRDE